MFASVTVSEDMDADAQSAPATTTAIMGPGALSTITVDVPDDVDEQGCGDAGEDVGRAATGGGGGGGGATGTAAASAAASASWGGSGCHATTSASGPGGPLVVEVKEVSVVVPEGYHVAQEVQEDISEEKVPDHSNEPPIEEVRVLGSGSAVMRKYTLNKKYVQMVAPTLACHISSSDVVPGIYEGGFKVWEGTHTLLAYLSGCLTSDPNFFHSKTVLDIGCGHGLLGTFALMHGATVHFQDYNADVLTNLTIRNIMLNCAPTVKRVRFFSGDWASVQALLQQLGLKYDLIVTSETVYNVSNMAALASLIKSALSTQPGSFACITGKEYYFGCGGGMSQFLPKLQLAGLEVFTVDKPDAIKGAVPISTVLCRHNQT
ncbi:histidine protein methyltransferase 1 [Pelomyxa schiedti]|nr:histidine protein methyltransferase 1 [Pelomyxa schiedti]